MNLDQLIYDLKEAAAECQARGMPNSIREKFLSAKNAAIQLEKARQAQDRTNG